MHSGSSSPGVSRSGAVSSVAVSALEFIAALASALGWPLAVVVIVLVLRQPIARMLTERPPRRVKAGPFEAEWGQALAQAETEVQGLPASGKSEIAAGGSLREELKAEAHTAPAVAVLEAFARVEGELRSIVMSVDPEVARMAPGAVLLARVAAQTGRISAETVRAVEGIAVLRNLSAHGGAREVTTEQALDYLDLVDAVLFTLRAPRR
jgi:hypothetical protein